jgi:GTP pyrophosphokinase
LAELELDEDTIIAGLLHDVVEDTKYTLEDVSKEFGEQVSLLVDGVTKLGQIHYETKEERQAENLRKMFLAMAKDIRVILIKLADRLHNMRTLKYMTDSKKKEKAEETLEIYAPIAHRLGISKLKWELEDLSFLYLDPEGYYDLVSKVNKKREERENNINNVIIELKKAVAEDDIHCEITGRPKNFYSIYKKMAYQNKTFEEIYDLTAIRIIVESIKDCYGVLGIAHNLWIPLPGRFKDYISIPKPNLYQSLHTTVMSGAGEPFKIQIRTAEMHRIAEYGIAAHWKYKEGIESSQGEMENRLSWLRQMMEWQRDLSDPKEFMDSLKIDLFTNQVFVFTPEGEVIDLPLGSTPVDFAYKIHSAVGNKCIGAKVNGRIVPLNFQLANGQIIEVLTSNNAAGPSRDWLKFVKSNQAKNKIKNWFKKERREDNIKEGKDMLDREIKRSGFHPKELLKDDWVDPIIEKLGMNTIEDLYAAIGYGGIMLNQIVPKLKEKHKLENKPTTSLLEQMAEGFDPEHQPREREREKKRKQKAANGVVVKGVDDMLVRFAKCCNPVPGDNIIGYITRGRGVTIHRTDCVNFEKSEDAQSRFIEVSWDKKEQQTSYSSEVQIIAPDRKGLLGEVTVLITDLNLTVTGVNAKLSKNNIAIINLTLEISNSEQLTKLINKIKSMPDIIEVKRNI